MGEWVRSSVNSPLPPNAFLAGRHSDGSDMYVGRAIHEGDILPAKLIPRKRKAFISYDRLEHEITHYDVLVGQGYDWVASGDGLVPDDAVYTGRTSSGELLYVGRAVYKNTMTVGKVHPSNGCLFLSFDGEEISVESYEVLVRK
ncbi:uncharacterized protein LOC26529673 [Drosophila willistoni]|uniref:uncharacterized protein LOC26529673 n=1 Tax=Drosophila willistoni TaxID=7260 RepID=UPI000C26C6F5|nr:uncharacterized protein LOC26529673 [Drosophila willistoni]